MLKLVLTGADEAEARRFEGASFEEVLADAVSAGILKASCVSKQITFLAGGSSAAVEAARGTEAAPVGVDPPLLPGITAAISALIHETQRERGISSLYAASRGNRFGKELGVQWRATDRRYKELIGSRNSSATRCPRQSPSDWRARRSCSTASRRPATGSRASRRCRPSSSRAIRARTPSSWAHGPSTSCCRAWSIPPQRPTALAWMALLHAKEKTESSAPSWRAPSRGSLLRGTVPGRPGTHSPPPELPTPVRRSGPRFRGGADARPARVRGGFLRADGANRAVAPRGGFGVDAAAWFATISRHIDLLADVEATVRVSLNRWQP